MTNLKNTYIKNLDKNSGRRAQNPVNYQQRPVSSTAPNQAIKRQRASTSGHSKMDTSENFHLHASDEEDDTIPS